MEELQQLSTDHQISSCFDEALANFSGLVNCNLQLVRTLITLNKAQQLNEKAILKEIHATHKRSNKLERSHHDWLRFRHDFLTSKTNQQKKQLRVQQSLISRFYQRLRQRIVAKLQIFHKHQRHLVQMSATADKFYSLERQTCDPQQYCSFFLFQQIIKALADQNELLYKVVVDRVVQRELVSSVDEFLLLNKDDPTSPHHHRPSKFVEPVRFQPQIKKESRKLTKILQRNELSSASAEGLLERQVRLSNKPTRKHSRFCQEIAAQSSKKHSLLKIEENEESRERELVQNSDLLVSVQKRTYTQQSNESFHHKHPHLSIRNCTSKPLRKRTSQFKLQSKATPNQTMKQQKQFSVKKFICPELNQLTLEGQSFIRTPNPRMLKAIQCNGSIKGTKQIPLDKQRSVASGFTERLLTEEHHSFECHRIVLKAVDQQSKFLPKSVSENLKVYVPTKLTESPRTARKQPKHELDRYPQLKQHGFHTSRAQFGKIGNMDHSERSLLMQTLYRDQSASKENQSYLSRRHPSDLSESFMQIYSTRERRLLG